MNNDVPIVQKVYDFYRELYKLYPHIPKQDRYVLGERIQETILELFKDLILASHQGKHQKLETLSVASAKLDLLKNLLRLAEDVKAISTKRYLSLSENLQEIGRMLGGWIRSLN
ncbi:MAG: diversity-generating retroelement protein Avd [Patescibacteria group bacterium]|nr:diversity-generating retroelement protein Avd [Patescibacteria group bacterium]